MNAELNSRERVLSFFRKEEIDRVPVFSGFGNDTVHGLEKYGLPRRISVRSNWPRGLSTAAVS